MAKVLTGSDRLQFALATRMSLNVFPIHLRSMQAAMLEFRSVSLRPDFRHGLLMAKILFTSYLALYSRCHWRIQ